MKKLIKLIMMFSIAFVTLGMMGCGKSDETLILGEWINEDEDVIEFFEDNTCTVEAIFPESYGSSKYIILKDGRIKITSIYNEVETFDYSVKKDELVINGESFFRELKNKEEKESKEDTNRKVENTNKEEINIFAYEKFNTNNGYFEYEEVRDDDRYKGIHILNYEGNDENLEIPNKINGINVVYIAGGSFKESENLTSVKIPNSVKGIGFSAFKNCYNLVNINIPNSEENISPYVFSGCKNLCNIDIPDSVKSIAEYAFEGCSNLSNINIPNSVTKIAKNEFSDCDNLIITGHKGSYAEYYANQNKIKFKDINGNFKILIVGIVVFSILFVSFLIFFKKKLKNKA